MTTVYEALAAVMADVDHVAKRDKNRDQGFMFRGLDAVVNAVAPALRKNQVLVVPTVERYEYGEILVGKNRTPMGHARVVIAYTFYGPEGDFIKASAAGEAFDSGDKATPKASSVAFRTALLQALALPTDEPDPDSQSYERAHQAPHEDWKSDERERPTQPVPPLAVAKARAWNAAKALWTADTDDERKASTEAALAGMGSSIADADTATWNTLAEIWEDALRKATKGAQA
jgi:hypothetical protein